MRNYCLSLLSAILLLAFFQTGLAQTNPNLETGLKPFGSYDDAAFDTVSLTNGNLILHIPIFDYPQRGNLKAQFALTYNGKGWKAFMDCVGTSCISVWDGINVAAVGLQLDGGEVGDIFSNVKLPSRTIQVYTAITSDGGTHQLAATSHGGYESIDGSGIFFNPNGNGVLFDRNGSGFNQNLLWQDTNGNYLTSYLGTQTTAPSPHIDTLGRSLPAVTADDGSGSAGCVTGSGFLPIVSTTIVGIMGPNGTQDLIKTCLVNVSVQTAFNAYDYDSNGDQIKIQERSGSFDLVQSIILYNGSSWASSPQWSFQYSPNSDGSNYGDLTQVTLPTGGTIKYAWATAQICGNQPITPVSRAVVSRTVNANDGTGDHQTTYTVPFGSAFNNTVTDAAQNDTVHMIDGLGGSCSLYESETDYYAGTGSGRTLLKSVQRTYTSTANPFDDYGDGTTTAANVEPSSITTK